MSIKKSVKKTAKKTNPPNKKAVPSANKKVVKSPPPKRQTSAMKPLPQQNAQVSAKRPPRQKRYGKIPEKTAIPRPRKRKRVRGGNYTLYYLLAGIIVVIALIILSNTVFFKCTGIDVTGNTSYNADEIISAGGVKTGDNLFRISKAKVRENIINSLAYIDDAEVSKSFPTTLKIKVSEAEKQYCLVASGTSVVISRKGKILEHYSSSDLPVVIGYDPETTETGKWLTSKVDGKNEIPEMIFAAAEKTGLKNITQIDMKDKFSVKVTVENRVILSLGSVEELESKFRVAVKLIETELGKDEYVTLLLTNPEKVPVQNNSIPTQNTSVSSSSTATSSMSNPEEPEEPEDPEDPEDPENPEDPT